MNQQILKAGEKRSLAEFAKIATDYLESIPPELCDEVVQLADDITELKHDCRTSPETLHPLPNGYEYRFSGFFGQVIGIGRKGH